MIPEIINKTAEESWTESIGSAIKDTAKKLTPSTGALIGGLAGIGLLGAVIGGRNSRALLTSIKDGASEVASIPKTVRDARAIRAVRSVTPGIITSTTPSVVRSQLDLSLLNRFVQPGGYLSRSQYAYLRGRGLIP